MAVYTVHSSHLLVSHILLVSIAMTCLGSISGDCATMQIFPVGTSMNLKEESASLPLLGIALCNKICLIKQSGCLLACALYKELLTHPDVGVLKSTNKTSNEISVAEIGFNQMLPEKIVWQEDSFKRKKHNFYSKITEGYLNSELLLDNMSQATTEEEVKTSTELPSAMLQQDLVTVPTYDEDQTDRPNDHVDAETEYTSVPQVIHEVEGTEATTLKDAEPFQLRLVSLSLENSLIVAEITWNHVLDNVEEEYLVTWEPVGGGLKGNLVTDSVSTTLNLWQDTNYEIQVGLFQRGNLDFVGEPTIPTSPTLKSRSLFVDTTGPSLALEYPSPLIPDEDNDGDNTPTDEITNDKSGEQNTEIEYNDIFNTSFIESIVLVIFASLATVIVIYTMAVLAWRKFKVHPSPDSTCKATGLRYTENKENNSDSSCTTSISLILTTPPLVQVNPFRHGKSVLIATVNRDVLDFRSSSKNGALWSSLLDNLSQTNNKLLLGLPDHE